MNTISRIVAGLAVSSSLLLVPNAAHAASKQTPRASSIASIEVAASANAFTPSATVIEPKVSLKNTDAQPHQVSLIRLPAGVSASTFAAQFAQQGPKALAGTVSSGGPAIAFPGAASSVVVNLPSGTYIAADLVPASDGQLKATKGFLTSFTVKAKLGGRPASRPGAQQTVELHDFFFAGGAKLKQGTTIAVRNAGDQPHELVVFRLAPGKTAKDVTDYLMNPSPSGPPPFIAAVGMAGIAPKSVGYLTVDLAPGPVAFACFLPDVAGKGEPHFTKGMVAEGEVIA